MPCFEPTENTEVLNNLNETLTKLLNDYDSGLEG
jgi:hypothetical protein